MQQLDMFDDTLSKKIQRLERWIGRLQREMWFLKEVYNMSKRVEKIDTSRKYEEQTDIFGT